MQHNQYDFRFYIKLMVIMSSVTKNIEVLQDAYAFFCVDTIDVLSSDTLRTESIREFTIQFIKSAAQKELQPFSLELSKILHQWLLLCQEFAQNPKELSSLASSRVKKIGDKIVALTEIDMSVKKQVPQVSAAEAIRDLVKIAQVKEAHELELSDANKAFGRKHPKAIEASRVMLERIVNGVYGVHVKNQLFCELKSPLLLKERFCKILFVDLTLRGLDPVTSCEWFSKCPARQTEAAAHAIYELRDKLKQYGLPEPEILGSLMAKANYFSDSMKPKFADVVKGFEVGYSAATHELVLEKFSLYHNPSNKALVYISQYLLKQNRPTRALSVLSYVQGDRNVRKKCIKPAVIKLFIDNDKRTLADVQSYKSTDPVLYETVINVYLRVHLKAFKVLEASMLLEFANYMKQLLSLKGMPSFVKRSRELIVWAVEQDKRLFTHEQLLTLITSQSNLSNRLQCLDGYFYAQFARHKDDTTRAFRLSKQFVEDNFSKAADYECILSELAFCSVVAAAPNHFREVVRSLTKAQTYDQLFQRTIMFIFGSRKIDEAYNWVEDLSKRVQSAEQKQSLYRFVAEELIRKNDKRGLAVIDRIVDPMLKAHLTKLYADQMKYRSANNMSFVLNFITEVRQ
jgi:hypothetical protein